MKKKIILTLIWLSLGVFLYLAAKDGYWGIIYHETPPTLASKRFDIYLLVITIIAAGWISSLWFIWKVGAGSAAYMPQPAPTILARAESLINRLPLWLRVIISLMLLISPTLLYLYPYYEFERFFYWLRIAVLLFVAVLATLMLFQDLSWKGWLLRCSGLFMAAGAIYAAGTWLNQVTSYPFWLDWSEGNRFWDYSVLFGRYRYLYPADQPIFAFIEAGRQVLWGLPFIIPGIGIAWVRLWNALLSILPSLLLGGVAMLGASKERNSWLWKAGFALWAFLFISQGPIYAPLVISAILVVLGIRFKNLVASCLFVILASYYAYTARWTWMYAPGLWAGMLALLDAPNPGFRRDQWKALIRPVVLGLAGLFGGQVLPVIVSWIQSGFSQLGSKGMVITDVGENLGRQPLLWERLLPNPTYPPGVLVGALWAALPLLILLIWVWVRRFWRPNWLQSLGIVFPFAAFLGVGLVISVKIGGGSNLHNLDMLWISMVLVAAWAWKKIAPNLSSLLAKDNLLVILLMSSLIFPVTYALQYGKPLKLPQEVTVQKALSAIQAKVAAVNKDGKEILFLDHRQLLTFGYIDRLPLIPDYEKKYMMDKAMSGDAAYFATFYRDITRQRFGLIISEPLWVNYQSSEKKFREENDAWVYWVSHPVLCYYEYFATFRDVSAQLLVPRKTPLTDPDCPQP